MTTSLDDFVRIKDVSGVNPRLLAYRIRQGELDATRDPRDRRNLLVRRSDLERLMTPDPRPLDLRRNAGQAAELATA